jgi:Gpi18-like mannosyltransferase
MSQFLGFFFFSWVVKIGLLFLSAKFIPYLGFFPYQEVLNNYFPAFLTKLANFDGIHYILIAHQGYSQYEQAFFPLYPLLIHLGSFLIKNELIVALLISNLCFIFGWYFFSQYLRLILPRVNFFSLAFLLLFFPTAFYFNVVYTEGLFFFLLFFGLYMLEKKHYWQAAIGFFLLSLTRLIGIFVFIPILFHLFLQFKKEERPLSKLISLKNAILLSSPFLGLFLYMTYLQHTTGDWLFFFHAQPFFGASRSTKLIFLPQVYWRYLKIFLSASVNFQYFVSLIEFIIFNLVFAILIFDLIKNLNTEKKNFSYIGLILFSLVNLILPTLTGTFSSIPRYALLSPAFFIYLSQIKNKRLLLLLSMIFFIFHCLFFGLFIQGYFIS